MNHEAKDAHHGGTALVEFNGTLLELSFGIKSVPAKVNGTITEVTDEFGFSGQVTHDRGLEDTNEEEELDKSTGRDGLEGGETVGDGSEGSSRVVNVSGKADTGFLDQVANDGKHCGAGEMT